MVNHRRIALTAVAALAFTLVGAAAPHSFAADSADSRATCYQKISVTNAGGFALFFTGRFQTSGGNAANTATSSKFYLGQTRTIDFKSYGVNSGQAIWPFVKIQAGKSMSGVKVGYCGNGQTAAYKVGGTTLDHWITLLN